MSNHISPKIYEVLKKAVNGQIENFEITVHDPNKKGEGYLGQIFFISLKEKNNGKQLNYVVKQAFAEQSIREFSPIREVFLNEIYFYTKLWPDFTQFQERVPEKFRFNHLAKCLTTIPEENFERLVLENLKHEGFVMHDKKKALEKDKFELIFKLYGRFHAISFAYKALNPERFAELVEGVYDVFEKFVEKDNFSNFIKFTHEECLQYLEPGVEDAVIEKYKHYIEDGMEIFKNSLAIGKYTAIVHGDCWSNNMMFKYDEFGDLLDVRLLDFQLINLGSPVCDLSYCLYSGGTKAIFDDLDHLLQVYHDSLSECLRAYGCDPNELYPLEALKNDWKVHCQLGMGMGLSIWRGKLVYDEEIVDLTDIATDEDQGIQKFKDSKFDEKTYKQRTRDIILHLYENDFLC